MHITPVSPYNLNRFRSETAQKQSIPVYTPNVNRSSSNIGQINFGALYGIKTKKFDIEVEKTKLLKQINELLELDTQDTSQEDIIAKTFINAINNVRNKMLKEEKLQTKFEEIQNSTAMNLQQKHDGLISIKRELMHLRNPKKTAQTKPAQKPVDERIDYSLLNKFKSAIDNNDFNLDRVFKEYYGDLKNITSIEELNEKFPKIKTPKDPREVIAQKMADTLTRDFYEEIEQLAIKQDNEGLTNIVVAKLKELCSASAKANGIDEDELFNKTAITTASIIRDRYKKALKFDSFSYIPQQRKNKLAQLTENDKQLLKIDMDDFVLSVTQKMYLEGKKPQEITYSDATTTIPLSKIKDSAYKFDKIPEKIKSIITKGRDILAEQRNYKTFDTDQLKARLEYYAGTKIADNEEILNRIIEFDSCRFEKEDITSLVKFLKELDAISDGKKSLQEGIETIRENKLMPRGTYKLNELERQKNAEKIKKEHERLFQLNELKDRFDDAVNILYSNNMNNIANTCSKYRPENLNVKLTQKAEFIIKLISENCDKQSGKILNKQKLENNIMRWDTFNQYKQKDAENPLFQKALRISREPDGSVNIDKAGQYLINSEIVDNYPESLEFVRNREVLEKIMEKAGTKEAAIKYLNKYDAYLDLEENDKTYLSKFIDMFDDKDAVEKAILKNIIENEYVKCDTKVQTIISDKHNNTSIIATFGSQAKQQIFEKYNYPGCLRFLQGFEEALATPANTKKSSGIKLISRNNNKMVYKMEVKLAGDDDRLFSSKNDFYFDIFSEKGLH